MAKKYGTTELSNYSENLKKDQAERRKKLKKLFSGPLFPKVLVIYFQNMMKP